MITEHKYSELTWVNIEDPTRDEIDKIAEEYRVHPLVAEELMQPTIRPRVDTYDNFLYLILHFPRKTYNPEGEGQVIQETEVDFIVGKDFIITVHYDPMDSLHDFEKKFETSVMLKKARLGEHAGILFFYMMRIMYKNLQEDLDVFGGELKKIESEIFSNRSRDRVHKLANIRRHFLDFKQTIRFHGDILRSFNEEGKNFFGVDFSHYLSAITSEYWKVFNALEGHRETLGELRETHHLLLTTRTNKIMKTISMLAFVAVPITMIAQIIGAGILDVFIHDGNIFTVFLSATIILTIGMFAFFKVKKWL